MRPLLRSSVFFLLALAPTLAAAQGNPQTRKGFGISFGLGGGTVGTSCSGCTSERAGGIVVYLRIGGHVNQNLFLAGEANAWVNGDENIDESLAFSTFVAHWYPNTDGGLYLRAGIGISEYENIVGTPTGTTTFNAMTPAWTFGVGNDIRVGKNFSLTPFANAYGTAEATMMNNGATTGSKFSNTVLQFGLGFTWH